MATQCFLRLNVAKPHFAHDFPAILASAFSYWRLRDTTTTRGPSASTFGTTNTVTGPTNGLEIRDGGFPVGWITPPIDQDVTIAGTITLNIWALENSMSANVAINVQIHRLRPNETSLGLSTLIATTTRTTELNTVAAVNNFTVTPTSTNMQKGDRFFIRVFGDDAGTMATGFNFSLSLDGPTAGAAGDTYVTFTETFGFQTTAPSGSTLYLTSTVGPAVGSADERIMWTTRGGSMVSNTTASVAGPTGGVQITAGGVGAEWYSQPLQAVTLEGLAEFNIRLSHTAGNIGLRVELAVTNGDGSSPVIITHAGVLNATGVSSTGALSMGTTQTAVVTELPVRTTAVTDGQRIRLRMWIDDTSEANAASGVTVTLYYNGPTGGASGDSWVQFEQTLAEYVPPVALVGYWGLRNRIV